jgi:N6-L-threonylcarbamoyladenine synthase
MYILAIETSCDETAAAIIKISGQGANITLKILSNVVASQIALHSKYGGIIPEVAARAHIEQMLPVLQQAIKEASVAPGQIDLIGVTNGPGLITSLLVGVETTKVLSWLNHKLLLGINHLAGHFYAAFINLFLGQEKLNGGEVFPAVGLIVSGGHTELVLMKDWHSFKKIGQTLDDAAGECFDKVAKLLNLGYPGGPVIARRASQAKRSLKDFGLDLPRPMLSNPDYNFSFSGLKTAVLYLLQNKKNNHYLQSPEREEFVNALCQEVQRAAIDVLVGKTLRAGLKYKAKSIILGGGVAANQELRTQMAKRVSGLRANLNFLVPPREFCTDNALMMAVATYFKWQKLTLAQKEKAKQSWQNIKVDPNLNL